MASRLGAPSQVAGATTHSHTVPAGTDRVMVVAICWGQAATSVTSVDYGGQAMTRAAANSDGGGRGSELWYLLDTGIDAASGTTITPTWTGTTPTAARTFFFAQAYEGINQTGGASTVTATADDNTGGTPHPITTIDVTETNDGVVAAALWRRFGTTGVSWAADMTAVGFGESGGRAAAAGDRLSSTDGNVDIEGTWDTAPSSHGGCTAAFAPVAAGSGVDVAVGTAADTEVAQPVSPSPAVVTVPMGQASGQDTTNALTAAPGSAAVAIGQTTETSTAGAHTTTAGPATAALGQATQTAVPQPITVGSGQTVTAVGTATEVNESRPVTRNPGPVTTAIGQTTETDEPGPVAAVGDVAVIIGQTAETTTATALTPAPGVTAGSLSQATEAATGFTVTPFADGSTPVGLATETDTTPPLATEAGPVSVAVGQAIEADTTNTILPAAAEATRNINTANEPNAATPLQAAGAAVTTQLGPAAESESSGTVTVDQSATVPIDQTTEVDTTRPMGPLTGFVVVPVGPAADAETAGAFATSETFKPVPKGVPLTLQQQTLVRVQPLTVVDGHGNQTYDYGPGASRTALVGWLQQDRRTESFPDARNPTEQLWLLITNEADLDPVDRIEWTDHPAGPVTFEVHGPVEPAYSPAGFHHSEATLRVHEG